MTSGDGNGAEVVLVTGGAGFIGSEVVRQLAASGHEVIVLDNLTTGRRDNLDGIQGAVEILVGDIRDDEVVAPLVARCDRVLHLACLGVRHSIHSPLENHDVNAHGTLRLLKAAHEAKVSRFVYVSSSEAYGTAREVPMTENHPTFPETVYGGSKLAGEAYARAFYRTYGFETVVIRPFNTYGPRCHHEGDSGEVIPRFLIRCLAGLPMVVFGDGTQTRDFTYVSDTARGIIAAAFSDGCTGRTINIGSGAEICIRDLARAVAEAAGCPDASVVHESPRPGDVLRLCGDASLATELLGYRPEVDLRTGLRKLRIWYEGLDASIEELLAEEVLRNWEPAPS